MLSSPGDKTNRHGLRAFVGAALKDMPLFLTEEVYILVPLEATYRAAWEAVPSLWRAVLEKPAAS